MKKLLILSLLHAAWLVSAQAQIIWNYDFGTETGTFDTSGTNSTSFLPEPPTDGGSARVRVGAGGGSFSLINPGSGSYLQGRAPTGTGFAKFSISDFTPATSAFSLAFDITFSGGASGTWNFFTGNGTSFSDNGAFAGTETFTGLRWVFGANGTITTSNRVGGTWASFTDFVFTQDENYQVLVYGNNGITPVSYGENVLAADTFDLWVGGTKVASGLASSNLTADRPIDSFMFYGQSSSGNVATVDIRNLSYANHAVPEPSTTAALVVGSLALAALSASRRRKCESKRRGAKERASTTK